MLLRSALEQGGDWAAPKLSCNSCGIIPLWIAIIIIIIIIPKGFSRLTFLVTLVFVLCVSPFRILFVGIGVCYVCEVLRVSVDFIIGH